MTAPISTGNNIMVEVRDWNQVGRKIRSDRVPSPERMVPFGHFQRKIIPQLQTVGLNVDLRYCSSW